MPRFIVPPKYVYSQSSGELKIPVPNSNYKALGGNNGMLDFLTNYSGNMIAPTPVLPSVGNNHDDRSHSKITVTTIRWKLTVELKPNIVEQGTAFNENSSAVNFPKFPTGITQYPTNPNQFYKFRYMMVEFDEDLAINEHAILSWFYSTYCFYREPTVAPKCPLPTVDPTTTNCIPGPISVHSNIMRITTPWIGKFKILADKCFEITANRPRVSIDMTIPVNRVYTWNDELLSYEQDSYLITPHIYCFVLPPLSYEQDMSIQDKRQAAWLNASGSTITIGTKQVFATWTSWFKLNFIDI